MHVTSGSVKGYKGNDVSYRMLRKTEDASSIAVMLPGAGYSTQAPLFHFATGVCLNQSIDVLHVNYNYKDFSYEEITDAITVDVQAVVNLIFSQHPYTHIYLIAKSLGTIALSSLIKKPQYKEACAIWLTPLLQRQDVYAAMVDCKQKSLSIIGDKDPCYKEDRHLKMSQNTHISSILIPDVNHSLEYAESVIDTVNKLKEIVEELSQFITQGLQHTN